MNSVTFRTILAGGITVAVLDITNAMIFWALYRGTDPGIILQSVSAGLLGKEAFSGGTSTTWLGAFLQFFISFSIAAVYYRVSALFPALNRYPLTAGSIYGIVVYLVMNHAVVPLSKATPVPFMLPWFLVNFIGHIAVVGIPVALINRWFAGQHQSSR